MFATDGSEVDVDKLSGAAGVVLDAVTSLPGHVLVRMQETGKSTMSLVSRLVHGMALHGIT